jgi:hypothetical protein
VTTVTSGRDLRVAVWIMAVQPIQPNTVKGGGQLAEKVRVPKGRSILGTPLFLVYVNEIWRNVKSTTRLFADDCIVYRKIINNKDM